MPYAGCRDAHHATIVRNSINRTGSLLGRRVTGSPGQSRPGRVGSRVSFADSVPFLARSNSMQYTRATTEMAKKTTANWLNRSATSRKIHQISSHFWLCTGGRCIAHVHHLTFVDAAIATWTGVKCQATFVSFFRVIHSSMHATPT
jgi:hypothetical protein